MRRFECKGSLKARYIKSAAAAAAAAAAHLHVNQQQGRPHRRRRGGRRGAEAYGPRHAASWLRLTASNQQGVAGYDREDLPAMQQ